MELRRANISLLIFAIVLLSLVWIVPEDSSAERAAFPIPEISIGFRRSQYSQPVPNNYQPGYFKDARRGIFGTVFLDFDWHPDLCYVKVEIEIDAGDWKVDFQTPLTFSRAQNQQSFCSVITIPWNTPAHANNSIDFFSFKWQSSQSICMCFATLTIFS